MFGPKLCYDSKARRMHGERNLSARRKPTKAKGLEAAGGGGARGARGCGKVGEKN